MNKNKDIFTIGDKTNNGIISKFEIDTYGVRVFFVDKPKNYHVSLNSIKHIKKEKLFCTEDGVDVFEGDYYHSVEKKSLVMHCNQRNNYASNEDKFILFSSKEAALKYIEANKVLFVSEDGINIYPGVNYYYINETFSFIFDQIALPTINYNKKDNITRFSTREAAKEYILMNKPCLSLNDVAQFYKGAINGKNNNSKGLINLVKSKL